MLGIRLGWELQGCVQTRLNSSTPVTLKYLAPKNRAIHFKHAWGVNAVTKFKETVPPKFHPFTTHPTKWMKALVRCPNSRNHARVSLKEITPASGTLVKHIFFKKQQQKYKKIFVWCHPSVRKTQMSNLFWNGNINTMFWLKISTVASLRGAHLCKSCKFGKVGCTQTCELQEFTWTWPWSRRLQPTFWLKTRR